METLTIEDPVFGRLTWDGSEWLGKARLDDLRNFGSVLPDFPEELSRGEHDPQKLFKEGAFRLVVRPGRGEQKQPPVDEQRRAWEWFLQNREKIMAQVMDRALEAYVRQRPARLHWWTVMYGADDPLLPEFLPEIHTVDELRKLVRPLKFVIWETSDRLPPPAWITIHFDAAWDRETGFAAQLRDGEIVRFGSKLMPDNDAVVDVPPFGTLRNSNGTYWSGMVHFEPFARMRPMEDERKQNEVFRKHPFLRPALDWDFVDANFILEIVSPKKGEIASQQIEAFAAFVRDPQRSASQVLQAIFDQYCGFVDRLREQLDPEDADRIAPLIESVDGLRDLIQFQTMTISTPDDGEEAFVGLGFACVFDEDHGLYVRWRGGKVEEVGTVDAIM